MKSLTKETSFMKIPYQDATPEFEAKRLATGTPCIAMTDNGDYDNTVLNSMTCFLFHFRKGASLTEATYIQELLEKDVEKVSVMGI